MTPVYWIYIFFFSLNSVKVVISGYLCEEGENIWFSIKACETYFCIGSVQNSHEYSGRILLFS